MMPDYLSGETTMRLARNALAVLLGFFSVCGFANPYTGSPEEIGLAIMSEVKARDLGWGDSSAEMIMTLHNKNGDKSVRKMTIKSLEVTDDGDKGLTVFNEPKDVSGTAFLSFSHVLEADEQWLYLPALKRVKRIASKNKSGPFMGSEFAYEDLTSFEVEKFTYKYLGEEHFAERDCYLVEAYPADEFSGYSKQVVWVGQNEYRVHKVDFYDRRNTKRKTLLVSDFERYLDKFWRPLTHLMTNHFTGKSTGVRMENIKFKTGLADQDFNRNALMRAR